MNEKCLTNKVCLVTGSNKGIGQAIVRRFANEGAIVYAGMRNVADCQKCIDSIIPIKLDLMDENDILGTIKRIKTDIGRLDVLVNNAGMISNEPLGMISRGNLRDIFEVNVFGLIDLSQQVATRFMQRQNTGSIINISSVVGLKGASGQCAYSASKGAVISATYSMAKELAPFGVRVNAIAPGIINTERVSELIKGPYAEAKQSIRMRRLGSVDEVVSACLYFASDNSMYTTGQVLSIDGGIVL